MKKNKLIAGKTIRGKHHQEKYPATADHAKHSILMISSQPWLRLSLKKAPCDKFDFYSSR